MKKIYFLLFLSFGLLPSAAHAVTVITPDEIRKFYQVYGDATKLPLKDLVAVMNESLADSYDSTNNITLYNGGKPGQSWVDKRTKQSQIDMTNATYKLWSDVTTQYTVLKVEIASDGKTAAVQNQVQNKGNFVLPQTGKVTGNFSSNGICNDILVLSDIGVIQNAHSVCAVNLGIKMAAP